MMCRCRALPTSSRSSTSILTPPARVVLPPGPSPRSIPRRTTWRRPATTIQRAQPRPAQPRTTQAQHSASLDTHMSGSQPPSRILRRGVMSSEFKINARGRACRSWPTTGPSASRPSSRGFVLVRRRPPRCRASVSRATSDAAAGLLGSDLGFLATFRAPVAQLARAFDC